MAASVAATTMVIRSVASEILPPKFMSYVKDGLCSALKKEVVLLRSSPVTKDSTTAEPRELPGREGNWNFSQASGRAL
ncbi:hypothetical protein VIGAN_09057600 [Vigna angularis var. angularis]|uniref:Uncharacterized protein n=1 Tax=Vigna angularis var. angularis TaxID=157739 RepID=A0A0S3SWV9_PHAAN|nr:hypothetical protein VIGAN_09057600 [Vigna angularis var. angularis]